MWVLIQQYWKPVALAAALGCAWIAGYDSGGDNVQQKWDAESTRVAKALVESAQAVRANEQRLQDSMNEVQRDATQQAEALRLAADVSGATADRLREQVNKLLAASQVAGTCASRTAANNPGNLLAVVLDKSVTRNRELAAFADSAMNAARSCRSGYFAAQQKAPD